MEFSNSPCEDYLYRHHDSGLLLAAIAEGISNEGESIANKLLASEYEVFLKEAGWELLEMFIPHLTTEKSKCFALMTQICHLCSPKEMCLVLMEQLQISSSTTKLTLLLPLLQSVLLKVKSQIVVNSSLSDFCSIVQHHITALKQQQNTKPEQASDSTDDEEEDNAIVTTGVTCDSFTKSVLEFLSPFIQEVHEMFCQANGRVEWYGWSPLQQHCVSVLLDLLEYTGGCSRERNKMKKEDNTGCIMREIVRCHCGCLQLLEWRAKEALSQRRRKDELGEEEYEPQVSLSRLGLAIFTHQLLVEECMRSYLPAVLSSEYLLLIGVHHALTLLSTSNLNLLWKGMALLELLINKVPAVSLPPSMLDGTDLQLAGKVLCDVMVGSSRKKLRQKAVHLLPVYIGVFTERGRYLILRHLLQSVSHAGLQGFLIHTVKEEVSRALNKQRQEEKSEFLGGSLNALSSLFLSASPSTDVMEQFDRIMAALNYLRYLLLRDKPSQDKTLVWAKLDTIKHQFLFPVRTAITTTQHYCSSKLATPNTDSSADTNPEVSVTVEGKQLPDLSPQLEREMLGNVLFRLDIMTSVLVRVEELCDSRTISYLQFLFDFSKININ